MNIKVPLLALVLLCVSCGPSRPRPQWLSNEQIITETKACEQGGLIGEAARDINEVVIYVRCAPKPGGTQRYTAPYYVCQNSIIVEASDQRNVGQRCDI